MAPIRRMTTAQIHRSGMTLVELLTAAVMTAVVSAAAASLLSAASNASSQSRNTRTIHAAGYYAEGRIGATVRQSRAIGQVTATKVSLWLSDANNDDRMQLSETGVIYYDSNADGIFFLQTDSTATNASTTLVPTATLQTANTLDSTIRSAGSKSTQWAEDVQACAFDGYPSSTDMRVVSAVFTLCTGNDATDFAVTASPKAPGDYLFSNGAKTAPSGSETRYKRSKVSPYSGVSTAQ